MKEKEEKLWCPSCNQGWVRPVLINKLNIKAYLCSECENLWLTKTKEEIQPEAHIDFSVFMESRGLEGNESKITILDNSSREKQKD